MQHNSCEREGSKEEKHGRSNPAETPRSVKKEVGGGVLGMGAEIPLQPVEEVMVKQIVLLEPMEVQVEQIHTAAHRGSHARGSGCTLKKAAAHGESTGAGCWQKMQLVERSLH